MDDTVDDPGRDGVPVVRLEPYTGSWPDEDPDANFRADVALYSQADPLATLRRMGRALDVPVGALVRYVLAKWATGGSEALLELGPSTVQRMRACVAAAEEADTDAARLQAYVQLRAMIGWMAHGLDDPAGTYPDGGG